jgi:hypothetical protein
VVSFKLVYCVNGCWSIRLGYVGVGFEGNCDRRYGVLYAPMLGGGYVGYILKEIYPFL